MITPAELQRRGSIVGVLGVFMVVLFFVPLALSVKLAEPEAAHAYPGVLDLDGKKLADGEFMQWTQNDRLHVRISYKFSNGQSFEEKAVLRQTPELIQEEWSWKELKDGQLSREFAANSLSKTATAQKLENGEIKHWSEKIDVESGRTFEMLKQQLIDKYGQAKMKEIKSGRHKTELEWSSIHNHLIRLGDGTLHIERSE